MLVIPVLVSGWMILGGAFDYFKMTPRGQYQIFDRRAVEQNHEFKPLADHETKTKYVVPSTMNEVLEFLHIDKAVALKAVGGEVPIRGLGGYLSRFVDRSRTVEVLFVQEINTGTMTFSQDLPKGEGWQDRPPNEVGTHFVSDIVYGGQLFISVQFRVDKPEQLEAVRNEVVAKIGQAGGANPHIFSKLQEVADSVSDNVTLSINVATTTVLFNIPNKISDLQDIVELFPSTILVYNDGKGTPLYLYLRDIHAVDDHFPEFVINDEVMVAIDDVEDMIDDLRSAGFIFREWDRERKILSPEQEKKVKEFVRHWRKAYKAVQMAIYRLDVTGSTSQFDLAKKAYDYDGEKRRHRYTREVRMLIDSLNDNSYFRSIYSKLLAVQEELAY